MMDRITHSLVVFCQIGAVVIALTLVGAVMVWAIGPVASSWLGVTLVTAATCLLVLVLMSRRRA